jgi:hypothetical protein
VQHDDAGRNPHRVRRRPHPPRRRRLPQRTTSPRARPPETPLNQVHPENMLALHKWGPRSFRRCPLSTTTQRYRKSFFISSAEYLISSECRHLPCADGPETTTTRLHSDAFIPIPRRQSAHQPIRRDGAGDRPFPQHKHCDRNQCRSMHANQLRQPPGYRCRACYANGWAAMSLNGMPGRDPDRCTQRATSPADQSLGRPACSTARTP